MAKTIKIIVLILSCSAILLAQDVDPKGVYFKISTPYLLEISTTLEKHDLELKTDSLQAYYTGELFYYRENNDSIRCEIQLRKGQESPFILDSFMTEPVSKKNVRSSVAKFSIWMLFLNALTAILFFVRST